MINVVIYYNYNQKYNYNNIDYSITGLILIYCGSNTTQVLQNHILKTFFLLSWQVCFKFSFENQIESNKSLQEAF